MENSIIVPFDLNTARKIKSGEIEGSVLIDDIKIEFVYESKDCANSYSLLFVKKDGHGISAIYADTEGCTLDGRGNTERLVARNPKLKNLLEDGEYIPSLGQLNLIAHYKDSINDTLEYIGAESLGSAWHWSSTESSQPRAWYVNLSNGSPYTNTKYNSGRIRTVINF